MQQINILKTTIENRDAIFGQLASSYSIGRKMYPHQVFDLLLQTISTESSLVELGCGTGIATKTLYEIGYHTLIATDVDPLMLEEAKHYFPQGDFHIADTQSLPFSDNQFDGVLAFGCFHWFCNSTAINEIKRVLKPNSKFIVVNKQDVGILRNKFRCFLEALEGRSFIEPKSNYKPKKSLLSEGFSIESCIFESQELFTKEELFHYLQSISLWSSLSAEKQRLYLPSLNAFIDETIEDKNFIRDIQIQCLIAHI